jgi:nucleoside phosphorylase
MPMNISDVKSQVDFGILTIREDEFGAVLKRLPKPGILEARRRYRICQLPLQSGEVYTIATLRCAEQGTTDALNTARDLLEELDPSFLLVVGIAGGVPAYEFTLGDVIVSTRIADFSVEAVLKDHGREYAIGGGPLAPEAVRLAADIPAMVLNELKDWNAPSAIGMAPPPVDLTDANFYGDSDWQKDARAKLEHHFDGNKAHPPRVAGGVIASSDRLIKEAEMLQVWLKFARQILAVEMESAGVYKAAHGRRVPFLAIRGISDIVGFKRHPDWTTYACNSAAAFMHAFLVARPIPPRVASSTRRVSESAVEVCQMPSSTARTRSATRGHGGDLSTMDTRALLEASIGSDAYLAAEAAIEVKKRGPDETKLFFQGDWQKAPNPATTENFLRDVFHTFGESFAHHLVDVLEGGDSAAVNVAIYAFPRASMMPNDGPGSRLYSWAAGRILNRRLGDWSTMLSPIIAVGSAGLATFARDVIKRADDKRHYICGETLVRLFVQAESRYDADNVLEVMREFVQNAHDQQWPTPLVDTRLPAWRLTSSAIDSLVERGLSVGQLPVIREFASTALYSSGARRVVPELVQRTKRDQIYRAEAIPLLTLLGGHEAAQFVFAASDRPRDRALVLSWLVPTLDETAINSLLRDEQNRCFVARALGLAKTKADWIKSVLGSTNWVNRGYAGLGLAYARGSEAKRAIVDALDDVHGEESEAVHERILLNAALVVAGEHEHAQDILRLLPAHSSLRTDLAKQDVVRALSLALGRDHPAVRAWRRVGCAPERLDPEVSNHAAL